MSKNPKNWWKLMKIANIDRELLHIFWTTWGNWMKFSGKICFKIMLQVTKNQGFILSLEDTFFEKPQGGVKLTPSFPPAVLGLRIHELEPIREWFLASYTLTIRWRFPIQHNVSSSSENTELCVPIVNWLTLTFLLVLVIFYEVVVRKNCILV